MCGKDGVSYDNECGVRCVWVLFWGYVKFENFYIDINFMMGKWDNGY